MPSTLAPSSSAFTRLSALIPDKNKIRFSTPLLLALNIVGKVAECLDKKTGCYILVTGVAPDMVRRIHQERDEHGISNVARFTYDPTIESLIIRLMPGARHGNVSWSFGAKIQNNVGNIPGHSQNSLLPVWANGFRFPSGRTKEGDGGFKSVDTHGDYRQWPSLMVEVGYWGSLPALRCDAQMWLEDSGGRINMVIIIEIAEDRIGLRLECWEMIADPNGVVAGNAMPSMPGLGQYFDIDHAGRVSPAGHDLVIPYRTLFDTSQHGHPDIVLSAGELSEWVLDLYSVFKPLEPYTQEAVALLK